MNFVSQDLLSNVISYTVKLIMYIIYYYFYKNFLGIKNNRKHFFSVILLLYSIDIFQNIYIGIHSSSSTFIITSTIIFYFILFFLLLFYCKSNVLLKIFTLIAEKLIELLTLIISIPFDFYIMPKLESLTIASNIKNILLILVPLIMISIQILIQYLFLRQLCKYISYKQDLSTNQSLILFIPCLSISLIAGLFYYMQQFKINNATYFLPFILNKSYYIAVPFISILLGFSLLITAYTLRKVIDSQEEKQKNILMEHEFEMQINHSKNIEKLYSDIRKVEHNMKNHLICLNTLVNNNDLLGIKSYITKLNNVISSITLKIKTGNVISDLIINEKYNIACSENITFNCDFFLPKNTSIDSIDLCILLSNILDNAIEACEKIVSENLSKKINIKSFVKEPYLIIECINSYETPLKYKNDNIITTKPNTDKHGFGLIIINEIASKYNGIVDIINENNLFTISIMLYVINS